MNELLLILLPFAAYTGWWLARSDRAKNHEIGQSDDYFRGLDYLLHDETEKAITVFTELVKVNISANSQRDIKQCLTLGRLLQKRGEVDRALHLHQSLLAGVKLNAKNHSDTLLADIHLAIADDFQDAGVMNRAIEHFQHALASGTIEIQRQAGDKLLQLYTRQNQFQDAINISDNLDHYFRQTHAKRIAHCHCELALIEDETHFDNRLQLALQSDPKSIRAYIMLADRDIEQKKFISAISHYRIIESISVTALIPHLDKMQYAFITLKQSDEWQLYLDELYDRCPHADIALLVAHNKARNQNTTEAREFLKSVLASSPSLSVLSAYFKLIDKEAYELITKFPVTELRYSCTDCGFRSPTHYWQCPGCGELETCEVVQR